jgi:adenylylsulfate kinase
MNDAPAFGIWITGLPASGKSTIVKALRPRLEALGLTVEVLESDEVRRLLTPEATYSPDERDLFYRALAFTGQRLAEHGVTVLFDATASRQAYRDLARAMIPRFLEVAVECPLEVCIQRDRKGTYQRGLRGESTTVPGLQASYEPPARPDLRIDTTKVSPDEASKQISDMIRQRLADAHPSGS